MPDHDPAPGNHPSDVPASDETPRASAPPAPPPAPRPNERDVVIDDEPLPASHQQRSELIDEESEDSFPASDAPSSWARPAEGRDPAGDP